MSGLSLIPVGSGAAYGRPDEAQSCHLVHAGERWLCLDMGSGTFNRLQRHVAPHLLDLVVISHLHPDHLADLMAMRVYMGWGPGMGHRVPVVGPPGLRELLVAFSGEERWDEAFTFLTPDRVDAVGDVRLRWTEVPHRDPTYAVRLEHGGRSLVYGADCAENPALVELARGAHLLVTECTFGPTPVPPGVPHLNAAAAARMANAAAVERLVITHCSPEWEVQETLAAARRVARMPVHWARPHQEFPA